MPINILVTVKQVLDPEAPSGALKVNNDTKRMEAPSNVPPVINGYDENAVEAALKIKEAVGGTVTVLSAGNGFVMDVMKKTLSMGSDELILVDDPSVSTLDAFVTAQVLSAAIKKAGNFDLILCGRQASDYDQATVPLGIAEILDLPPVTMAMRVTVNESIVSVSRVLGDGNETVEVSLPALVTVSNEIGQPRYPNLRGIMAASKKQPTVWNLSDLGLDDSAISAKVEIKEIFVPVTETECEYIDGDDDEEKGRNLALKLREAKII
jgi:electron transfer flavoprotein beta subunit